MGGFRGVQNACYENDLGSNLARVTCETSKVLLAVGQLIFHGDLPFSPYLTIDSAQN